MVLIDREEAAKLIRQDKDIHEDCQEAIHYNIGCEHSAQIVEQMKGQEIIHCKDCKHASTDDYCHCRYVTWWNGPDDYCSRAEKRGDTE